MVTTANADQRARAVRLMTDSLVTLAALLLAFLAFDDITTDNATDFSVEYLVLAACFLWLFVLAIRLIREHDVVLGATSLLILAVAAWGQRTIGPRTVASLDPHYLATVAVFAWWFTLALVLLRRGWSLLPEPESPEM